MEINRDFCGPVPIFPLPNVVLFPGSHLPLHIFELRYRRMLADALEGDGLIAMALMTPGWEADPGGVPAIHEIATVGRITHHQPLADGRANILLTGVTRIRVVEEPAPELPYRVASVEVLDDRLTPETLALTSKLAQTIHGQCCELFVRAMELISLGLPAPGEAMSPGRFFDRIASLLKIDPRLKQQLLGLTDVLERGQVLHRILEHLIGSIRAPDLEDEDAEGPPRRPELN